MTDQEVIAEAKLQIEPYKEMGEHNFTSIRLKCLRALIWLAEQPRLPDQLTRELLDGINAGYKSWTGNPALPSDAIKHIYYHLRAALTSPPKPKGWRVNWSGGGVTITDWKQLAESAPCNVPFTVVPL